MENENRPDPIAPDEYGWMNHHPGTAVYPN